MLTHRGAVNCTLYVYWGGVHNIHQREIYAINNMNNINIHFVLAGGVCILKSLTNYLQESGHIISRTLSTKSNQYMHCMYDATVK